jgi:hypothetical protein
VQEEGVFVIIPSIASVKKDLEALGTTRQEEILRRKYQEMGKQLIYNMINI